jgi:hypothetical protein
VARVLGEGVGGGLGELVDAGAGRIEGGQQRQGPHTHGPFDRRRLPQMRSAQRLVLLGG